jgi:hypothetical protein
MSALGVLKSFFQDLVILQKDPVNPAIFYIKRNKSALIVNHDGLDRIVPFSKLGFLYDWWFFYERLQTLFQLSSKRNMALAGFKTWLVYGKWFWKRVKLDFDSASNCNNNIFQISF